MQEFLSKNPGENEKECPQAWNGKNVGLRSIYASVCVGEAILFAKSNSIRWSIHGNKKIYLNGKYILTNGRLCAIL